MAMRCSIIHCALCYANRKGRSNYKGHWGFRPVAKVRRLDVAKYLSRPVPVARDSSSLGDWDDPDMASRYPALVEFLAVTAWDDGEVRQPGSLTLFTEEGRVKACVSDKDSGRMAFVTAGTFLALLSCIEEGLRTGGLDWRVSRVPAGGRKPPRGR